MSTFVLKGKPPLRLQDLLRKRKVTLHTFVKETGITTYQKLQEKCAKLGVSSPPEDEFKVIFPEQVSSPQEGVVVLDPPVLIKDTGEKVSVDTFFTDVSDSTNSENAENLPPEESLDVEDPDTEFSLVTQETSSKKTKKNRK